MQILICTILLDKQIVSSGKQVILLIREPLVKIRKPVVLVNWFADGDTALPRGLTDQSLSL